MAGPMTHAKSTLSHPSTRITRIAPRFVAAAALALLVPLLTQGCSTASYPSLARREAETFRDTASVAAPVAPSQIAPALLAQKLAEARAADARFADLRASAETALAAAQTAKAGDAAWARANARITEMERARGDLGVALAALDHLYAQDRIDHAAAPEDKALSQTRATVAALAAAQDRQLDALRARLP